MLEEECAAHTTNVCKKLYNERRAKQGEAEVAATRWGALVEQKASRGKFWPVNDYGTSKKRRNREIRI